jgi:hypothetical protein
MAGSSRIAKTTSKRPDRNGVYKCRLSRKQFAVSVGTIFKDSHIVIGKWLDLKVAVTGRLESLPY